MSRLDELIQEYCPDGVEYVKIKDYFTRLRGTPITAGKMKEIASEDGEIKIFAGGKTIIDAHEVIFRMQTSQVYQPYWSNHEV